jgi:hypothetical protein
VGIALAERETGRNRPVVAIIGDGSFQYSVQSIWSAAQLQLPILIVIMRNRQYTILKSFAELEHTPGVPGLDLPGMDFVSIAQGYGCDAARVEEISTRSNRPPRTPGPTTSRPCSRCPSPAGPTAGLTLRADRASVDPVDVEPPFREEPLSVEFGKVSR